MGKSVGGGDHSMWDKSEKVNYGKMNLPQLMLIAYQIKTGLRGELTEEFNNRTVSVGGGIKVMLS